MALFKSEDFGAQFLNLPRTSLKQTVGLPGGEKI